MTKMTSKCHQNDAPGRRRGDGRSGALAGTHSSDLELAFLPVWLWLISVRWLWQLEGGVAAAIGVGGAGVWLSGAGAGSTAAVGAASQALSAR